MPTIFIIMSFACVWRMWAESTLDHVPLGASKPDAFSTRRRARTGAVCAR